MIGKRISKYQITEMLGRGGMGEVYKADDTTLGRPVALKFLPHYLAADEEAKLRFVQEAKTASAIEHPNIYTIYEIGETPDRQLFIAMAYYGGGSLKDKIDARDISEAKMIRYVAGLARGLARAHEQGIIHRDIKPANLLFSRNGEIKLADFGLALFTSQTRLTQNNTTLGTTAYMAPEQVNGLDSDPRSDLWSLGVVLYEALTGQPPFRGEFNEIIINAIRHNTPKSPEMINPKISAAASAILLKTLEKDPDKRYQNGDLLAEALEEVTLETAAQEYINYGKPKELRPTARRKIFPKRISRMKAFLAGVSVLATAFLFFMLISQESEVVPSPKPRAADFVTITILPVKNTLADSGEQALPEVVFDIINTSLDQSEYLRLIPSGVFLEYFEKTGVRNVHNLTPKAARELVRQTQIRFVVSTSLVRVGARMDLVVSVFDLEKCENFRSNTLKAINKDDLMRLVDNFITKVKFALEVFASGQDVPGNNRKRIKTSSFDAYLLYIRGSKAKDDHRYDDAVDLLNQAIELDPVFAHAYLELARVYNIWGEEDLALNNANRAMQIARHDSPLTALEFGMERAKILEDHDLVLEHIKNLITLDPNNPEWWFQQGWHLTAHKRRFADGIAFYRQAITLEPRIVKYYPYLGGALVLSGQSDKAEAVYKQFARLDSLAATPKERLGELYLLTGRYGASEAAFQSASIVDETSKSTKLHSGKLKARVGKIKEAINLFREYIRLTVGEDKQREGVIALSRVLLENGNAEAALQEARRLVGSSAENIELNWIIGLTYLELNALDSARAILGKMEAHFVGTTSHYAKEFYFHLRGKFFEKQGQYDLTLQAFRAALLNGVWDRAFFEQSIADAWFNKGNPDSALVATERVLQFNINYPAAYFLRGQIFEKKNDIQNAEAQYARYRAILKDADEDMIQLQKTKQQLAQ